jgi:hypothetical protein
MCLHSVDSDNFTILFVITVKVRLSIALFSGSLDLTAYISLEIIAPYISPIFPDNVCLQRHN